MYKKNTRSPPGGGIFLWLNAILFHRLPVKTNKILYVCSVLLLTAPFVWTIQAQAGCGLPAATHAENISALTALLPGDARGVLAVDINGLLSGSSKTEVTGLLNNDGGDAALTELLSAINELAENVDLTGVMKTALLVQTTDAAEGLFLLAQLSCDTIGEVTRGPALASGGTYGTGTHALYRDLNGNIVSLLTGGVLIVGKLKAVQSVLDVVDGVSPARASAIVPFLSALQSGSSFSFVYGLPALFNSSISPDRTLRGAALVSGSVDFAGADISSSVSFHTSNASSFVDNYNKLNRASGEAPLAVKAPIARGLSQVVVTIPSTPISKSAESLIASRNTLKKLFPVMQAFDYAEDVHDPGNKPWLDFIIKSEEDGDGSPGSVFIRWEFKDQAAIAAFEKNELPEGFSLAPCRFLESDDPGYFLALNLYNAAGPIVNGARAEWDIFVQPPDNDTRPRYMCIDALAEAVSADSVNGLTQPQPVSHTFAGGRIVSDAGILENGVERTVFSSSIPWPQTSPVIARFTREMAIGNDYIYWGNGVLDRGLYNATTFNRDAVFVPVEITTDDSRWRQYLNDEPTYAVCYLNTLEYIISPWWNLDAPYLDITPEWLRDLYDFKNNGNYLTLMRDAVRGAFRGTDDALLTFTVENTTPSVYYNFQITDPDAMSAALKLPAGYRLARTRFFENDPAEDYYLTLVLYEIQGAVEGTRAEWRVYVDNGTGREHFMIIDLQTEDAAVDPVSLINLPSRVAHDLAGSTLSTLLSSSAIDFKASLDTRGGTEKSLSLDWIEAGDSVCSMNGICDNLYYDGETLDVPVHIPSSVTITTVSTPWNAFMSTTPSSVFYRDNVQEYAVKPWHNVKVVVEEEPPDPIEAGTHVIRGTGALTGRTNPAIDSVYTYSGAGTLSGTELYFTIDQRIENALGESHIITSGSFDLLTGRGTSTVENCIGPALMCAGVDPLIGTPDATSDYTASNLNAFDRDCITWDVLFTLSVPGFGEADSRSSLTAVSGSNCTDGDNDGYAAEGGCCGTADCDDNDTDVNPDAEEVCSDGIDNDCDGDVDEGEPENCYDKVDNDCDGLVDFEDNDCCSQEACCPLTITPSVVTSGKMPKVYVLRVTGDTAKGFNPQDRVTTYAPPGFRILVQFSLGGTRFLVIIIDAHAEGGTVYLISGSACKGELGIEQGGKGRKEKK